MMLQAEVPPARTDVALAVRLGRRAERRRRTVTAATAALAVVGVIGVIATTVLTPADRRDPPEPAAASPFATSVTDLEQIEARIPDAASSRCSVEPLAALPGFDFTQALVADSTGRYVVGGSASKADRRSSATRVLWDNGVPSRLVRDEPAPDRGLSPSTMMREIGPWGPSGPSGAVGRQYPDGQARQLTLPPGYDHAIPSAINGRGDVVGVAAGQDAYSARVPVIWPSGGYDAPRVLDEPGRYEVEGVTGDGSVIGTLVDTQEMRVWGADGTTSTVPKPEGWGRMSLWVGSGDWISGLVARDHDVYQQPSATLRWNVRTGKLSIFTNLDTGGVQRMAVNSEGWLAVATEEYGPLLVAPDGAVERLPLPAGAENAHLVSISDNGMVTGNAQDSTDNYIGGVTWKCR
ncbi:hypothetical protein [Plantactinospora soyae]|uniref:Uncharacterized protein n=1 Tax=Plantactinospora soyae TaxID=1544732 RepID=A0A927MJ24_9ACTN|nr:hypothetical protein [Plantactinospora soyae]MBE1492085.1 hypothetical protein [Plantactinospora soyae]